jgi:riboflavin biosynthesis pyrimidine reductase
MTTGDDRFAPHLEDLFAHYRFEPFESDRPLVIVNMVVTLDGRTAIDGRAGPLSSDADKALFRWLRAQADVILVGAGTVRAEQYGPVKLHADLVARRAGAGRPDLPRLAIISGSLSLPDRTLASEQRPILLTTTEVPRDRIDAIGDAAEIVAAGDARVDLPRALAALHERGARVVVCEGGESLNRELLALDLVDEWCIALAPILGGDPIGLAGPLLAPHRLALRHAVPVEDHVFLRYGRTANF